MKKIIGITALVILAVGFAFTLVGCSPVKKIENTLLKMAESNSYTLEIREERMSGTANYVRKYQDDRLYLNYSGVELYFNHINNSIVERYALKEGKWVKDTLAAIDIDFSMPGNTAYYALKLALKDIDKYYVINDKEFILRDEYLSYDETVIKRASIFLYEGKTVVRAELSGERYDEITISGAGKTEVEMPEAAESAR